MHYRIVILLYNIFVTLLRTVLWRKCYMREKQCNATGLLQLPQHRAFTAHFVNFTLMILTDNDFKHTASLLSGVSHQFIWGWITTNTIRPPRPRCGVPLGQTPPSGCPGLWSSAPVLLCCSGPESALPLFAWLPVSAGRSPKPAGKHINLWL